MPDHYNSLIPYLLSWSSKPYAVTLGQHAFFTEPEDKVSESWHRHEDKHKEQWAREGKLKFAVKYIWYYMTRGYAKSPYEQEAKQASEQS